jgi:excisionase family DNA binding protein
MTAALEAPPVAQEEWLTRAEVAALLKVGLRTVDRLASDGRLHRHYLGGSKRLVRFDAAQVRELASDERGEGES